MRSPKRGTSPSGRDDTITYCEIFGHMGHYGEPHFSLRASHHFLRAPLQAAIAYELCTLSQEATVACELCEAVSRGLLRAGKLAEHLGLPSWEHVRLYHKHSWTNKPHKQSLSSTEMRVSAVSSGFPLACAWRIFLIPLACTLIKGCSCKAAPSAQPEWAALRRRGDPRARDRAARGNQLHVCFYANK